MKKLAVVTDRDLNGPLGEWFKDEARQFELGVDYKNYKDADIIITLGFRATSRFVNLDNYKALIDVVNYFFNRRGQVIVPMLHPDDLYKEKGNKAYIVNGLQKVRNFIDGKHYKEENLIVEGSKATVTEYMEACLASKEVCIDLETSSNEDGVPNRVTAIGISKHPDEAFCISEDQLAFKDVVGYLRQIMESPSIRKIGQNFINFDSQVLYHRYSMSHHGDMWDTLDAFKILYPDLNQASLGRQGSMYLYCEPWKDEAWKERGRVLRTYCAKDVIRTYRIAKAQEEDLKVQGSFKYYQNVILPIGSAVARALHKGIKFDHMERKEQVAHFEAEQERLLGELREVAQEFLPAKKEVKEKRDQEKDLKVHLEGLDVPDNYQKMKKADETALLSPFLSKSQIKEYYIARKQHAKKGLVPGSVYRKQYKSEVTYKNRDYNPNSSQQTLAVFQNMGIDVPTKRSTDGTWKPGTGKLQLQQIRYRYPTHDKACRLAELLEKYKPIAKFISSYLHAEFPSDNRWRSQFKLIGTETNRASSRQYFGKYCGNIQNIPSRGIAAVYKKCFVPDPGMVWFNFDQVAAETWVQAHLAEDKNMLRILNGGIDFHSETARLMFGLDKSDEELKGTEEREIIAKALNHSSAYGVGPFIMSTIMMAYGRNYSKDKVQELQEKWLKAYPGIQDKFHKYVRDTLEAGEPLVNPLGRARHFTVEINDRMIKQAYADIPQSTVPAVSNLMWKWVTQNYKDEDCMVLIQTHDSLSGQVKKEIADEFKERFIRAGEDIKLKINGYEFFIPWDGGFGVNYYECK